MITAIEGLGKSLGDKIDGGLVTKLMGLANHLVTKLMGLANHLVTKLMGLVAKLMGLVENLTKSSMH